MAMFLSRIKKALNLGTKNITVNGTYNASSDGYDGYSSVEVNVAGVTPTPITPSNSSPAALTSGSAVSPTANGYAIESYSTVTPQEGIANQLVSGSLVKMNGSGYGIKDFTQITPSNEVPVFLTSSKFYKPSSSGYAIFSYSNKTPSDSSPASVSSGAIIKASASGYLYSTIQPKVKTGTVTLSTSGTTTVTCGFEPKYIALMVYKDATHFSESIYNKDVSTSNTYRGAINGGSSGCGASSFPVTSTSTAGLIMSTSSTGFKVAAASTAHGTNGYYFAIG